MNANVTAILKELTKRFPPNFGCAHAVTYCEVADSLIIYVWYKGAITPMALDNEEELDKGLALVDEIEHLLKSRKNQDEGSETQVET